MRTIEAIDNDLTVLRLKHRWTVQDRDRYEALGKEKRVTEYGHPGPWTAMKRKEK